MSGFRKLGHIYAPSDIPNAATCLIRSENRGQYIGDQITLASATHHKLHGVINITLFTAVTNHYRQ